MKTFKKIIKGIIKFIKSFFILSDYLVYKKLDKEKRFTLKVSDFYPQIMDKTTNTNFDAHYLYHTAWAIRKVKEINPEKHIDISSSLYFCSTLSAFIPVDFYDFRPAEINLNGLNSKHGNLLSLPFKNDSIKSISCMHTIEHIGLGRYGDDINPNGDMEAIKELIRVTAKNGYIVFVVPIGKPKIMFNAHRIYSYAQILNYFGNLTLIEFSLIPDNAIEIGIIYNSSEKEADNQNYGCGCFIFKK